VRQIGPRILAFDWFTSIKGQVIHRIDHDETKLVRGRLLILDVRAVCWSQISAKTIAFLSDSDAYDWVDRGSDSRLRNEYGPRQWCKGCK
jgi:hypothetical protein